MVIAEGGSTKTDWVLVHEQTRQAWSTPGLNPWFYSEGGLEEVIRTGWDDQKCMDPVTEVFFYGSGYGDPNHKSLIGDILARVWMQANIAVYTDLLAAARALFGSRPGLACILGTGSNSCLYDGSHIVNQIPSLGFILGDEGSGGWLGRELIRRYFYGEIPLDLELIMKEEFGMDRGVILHTIYHQPHPNRFIAGFAMVAFRYREHPYIQELLKEGFASFIRSHILKYERPAEWPIGFVGSVAAAHRDLLSQVLEGYGLRAGIFLEKPVNELAAYHLKNRSDV